MKKKVDTEKKDWSQKFEEIFILTCHDVHYHTERLMDYDHEIARELLIDTYVEAYQRKVSLPSIEKQTLWLKKVADSMAESSMRLTREEIEAAYMEGKGQSKEMGKEAVSKLDEVSVYLEVTDRISQFDSPEAPASRKTYVIVALKGLISLVLLGLAMAALLMGIIKVKQQIGQLKEPFVRELSVGEMTSFIKCNDDVKTAVIFADIFDDALTGF